MTYEVIKYIKGNPYRYLVRSVREGDRVRQVFVRYLGRADKPSREYLETEPVERRERIRRPVTRAVSEAVAPTVAVEAETPTPVEPIPIEEITPLVTPALEVTKEPWEMTQTEFFATPEGKPTKQFPINVKHRASVEKALSEGKPIPQEVLKDYPELAPKPTPEVMITPIEEKPITPEIAEAEYEDYQEVHQAVREGKLKVGDRTTVSAYGGQVVEITPPEYEGELDQMGLPLKYRIKEVTPIEPEITPITPINPYMNMPIERVRRDAQHGVKLAKEALATREAVIPEVTPVTPEVKQLKDLGWTDVQIAELDQQEISSIIRNQQRPALFQPVAPEVTRAVTLEEQIRNVYTPEKADIARKALTRLLSGTYDQVIVREGGITSEIKALQSAGFDTSKFNLPISGKVATREQFSQMVDTANQFFRALNKVEAEVRPEAVTPTAPAVEQVTTEVTPSDIVEFSQIKSPKEYQEWIRKQNVDLPYANFLRDIGKITEDPRYNYKEDDEVWLNEVGRNEIIKKAVQAYDSDIIDKAELQGFIDEFYEKQELTIDELIGYHKGTYKPSAIPQADKPMSVEEMDTIMDEYFAVKPPTAPAEEPIVEAEKVTIYHAKTKGEFPTRKPSTDIGSDADILGKGFYFGTKEYASRYGTPEAYTISGKFATQEQWVEALAKYDSKPIREQRALARESLKSEGYVGIQTKEVGVVWDDKAIQATPRAEVTPIPPEITTTDEVKAIHVTSNPKPVIDALKSSKNLGETRAEGLVGDLGASGLYVSNNPQMWIGRATSKWHFLKELTPAQKDKLIGKVIQSVDEQMKYGGIADFEYQTLMRDINYVKEGKLDAEVLVSAANQPFNIAFWKPEYLSGIDIEQTNLPIEVPVTAKGKFADVTKMKGGMTQDLIDSLKAQGYDGMIHRGSWGTPEQTVIWNPKAIESFGEYTTEAIAKKPTERELTPEIPTDATILAKDFNRMTHKEVVEELKSQGKPLLIDDLDKLDKLANYRQGYKPDIDRPVLVHRAIEHGIMTDGFLLVESQEATEQVIGKFLKSEEAKEARKIQKLNPNLSKEEAEATAREMFEGFAKQGTFPDYKRLYPSELGKEVELIGVYAGGLEGIEMPQEAETLAYLSDGEHIMAVNADKLAFVMKHLPNAKMYFAANQPLTTPLTFKVGDESKGMLMPMRIEDIPPIVQEKARGFIPKKPKPEPEPAREVREPVKVDPEMAGEILEGYDNLEEAREALSTFADRDVVGYTARGQEVTPDMLRQAIDIKSTEAITLKPETPTTTEVKFSRPLAGSKGGFAIMDYKATTPIDDPIARQQIIDAYNKVKSPLGYATYNTIHRETKLPYETILGVLKQEHINDPYSIHFNVDRMGKNIYFKLERLPRQG